MAIINVTIKNGKAVVEVQGAAGQGCTELTKKIEDALGTSTNSEFKPEFYVQGDQGEQQCQ